MKTNEWRGRRPNSDGGDGGEEFRVQPRMPAIDKLAGYVARRDHSELELRQKLSRLYTKIEIDAALAYAQELGMLASPQALAELVAVQLGRRRKGHTYIAQYLKRKGLPSVGRDTGEELSKGLALVKTKLDKTPPFDYEEKKKIHRLLTNRGFDHETIHRVLGSVSSPCKERLKVPQA